MYLCTLVSGILCYLTDDVPIVMCTFTRKLVITAKSPDTIWNIKQKIEERIGISPHHQQLQLEGRPLDDSYILSSSAELTLHLKPRLCG